MLFSDPENIISFTGNALPGFRPNGKIEVLSGGNLNFVWRVWGEGGGTVIVKYAPPYIAKAPDIPISPRRILIEAAVLRLFDEPLLQPLGSGRIHPPKLLYADEKEHAIILEDVGVMIPLDEIGAEAPVYSLGRELGAFIGRLHRFTCRNRSIAEAINNREIQQTRLEVQYARTGPLLRGFGVGNAAALGEKARKLGEKYLSQGKCLIMGDLWPRSVLVAPGGSRIRLIDWEFAHYGRPAQDVAHFLAHLWMLQHRAGSEERRSEFRQLQHSFMENYLAELGPEKPFLWDKQEWEDANIHFGAEILARTLGSFQAGYLYEGLAPGHPAIREAVGEAVRRMGNG